MKKKTLGIVVCMLLIATAVLPAVGSINIDKNQDVNTSDEPDGFQKPSRRSSKPLLLPPFLLQLVNGDWDYWSSPPHMYTIPEGNVGIGTSNPTSELEVVGNVEADSFTINGVPVGTSTDSYWSEGEEGNIYYNGDVDIDGDLSVTGAIDPTWVWFVPQTTEPLDTNVVPNIPLEGTLYYDKNTESFRFYKGGNYPIGVWTQLGGGGGADDDWYKVGTTSPPNDINDDIFTEGKVAISSSTDPTEALTIGGGLKDAHITFPFKFGATKAVTKIYIGAPSNAFHNAVGNILEIKAGDVCSNPTQAVRGGELRLYAGLGAGSGASDIVFFTGSPENTVVRQTHKEVARFLGTGQLRLQPLQSGPSNPADGDIAYADGVTWNPGGLGEGFYGYYDTSWKRLG